MGRSSIFRDVNARTNLQPQSTAQNTIQVTTVDELKAALTTLPSVNGTGNCYGKAIDIVADLVFPEQVTLDRIHDGLRITSSSRSRITTTTHLSRWLKYKTRDLQVDGLFFANGFDATTIFEADEDDNSNGTTLRDHLISDSIVATSFAVLNEGGGEGMIIADNRIRSPTTLVLISRTGADPYIGGPYLVRANITGNDGFKGGMDIDIAKFSTIAHNVELGPLSITSASGATGNNTITGNVMEGAITIADDGANAIVGNAMQAHAITTNTSGGFNTIVGNTRVSAITAAGTDAVGNNT